ncbi:unnamed protein product, partial [Rotaria sp. Silwood2]
DQSDKILSRIPFVYISQQCRYVYENFGRKYEKLTLIHPNKYVDVGRKQWNYFTDEYEFDNDVHVVFNRILTNIGRKILQTFLVEHIYDANALVLRHID